jgi:pilus assembly protein TadC
MNVFAILCICLAVYLWFPLPRQIATDLEVTEKTSESETESDLSGFDAASGSEILRALEIIQLGLGSGMTISDAFEYSKKHSPPAAANEIDQVLNQFRIGMPLADALEKIATANPGWRSIFDTLIASLNSGSPVADQLSDVAFILQSSMDTERLKRIKSVAVKSVLPLGLCFLPAFILLAVIPVIAGLLRGFI